MKNKIGNGKVVLVTGASSGFGKSIATLLSGKGYTIFGTSRKPKGVKVRGFELLQLDVTSEKSIRSCVSTVIRKTGRIDVLVNNAGYAAFSALEENSIEEAMAHFDTNFFGVVRMVNAVLPTMRMQEEGRIINISSMVDTIQAPFQGFYASTKAALTSYTESLRMETKSFNIKVSLVEPGFFKTNLFDAHKKTGMPMQEYRYAKEKVRSALERDIKTGGNPDDVARLVLRIIETENPKIRYPIGKEKVYLTLKKIVPESAFENSLRKHFGLDEA